MKPKKRGFGSRGHRKFFFMYIAQLGEWIELIETTCQQVYYFIP